MDDYFVRMINLVSEFGRSLFRFVEDLVFGGFERFSEDSNALFKGCYRTPSCDKCNLPFDGCPRTSHSEYGQRRTECAGHSFVNRNFTIVGSILSHSKLHQGIELGFRLTSAFWRCSLSYFRHVLMLLRGFIYRMQRTLKGSSEDIGWLKRIGGLPAVEDGIIRFMEKEGIRPDALIYNLLISGFCRQGNIHEGNRLIKAMASRGIQPDKATYASLINAHAAANNLKAAFQLHDEMLQRGFIPDDNF